MKEKERKKENGYWFVRWKKKSNDKVVWVKKFNWIETAQNFYFQLLRSRRGLTLKWGYIGRCEMCGKRLKNVSGKSANGEDLAGLNLCYPCYLEIGNMEFALVSVGSAAEDRGLDPAG